MVAGHLLTYLRSRGCKVSVVRIADPADRTTWTADHDLDATVADRAFTAAELAAATPVAIGAAVLDAQANGVDTDALIQAVAQLDFEERQKLTVKVGQTLRTAAECKARIKAIYRSLL